MSAPASCSVPKATLVAVTAAAASSAAGMLPTRLAFAAASLHFPAVLTTSVSAPHVRAGCRSTGSLLAVRVALACAGERGHRSGCSVLKQLAPPGDREDLGRDKTRVLAT